MNINKFAKKITEIEGKKKQVNIAQVKEMMSTINKLTGGVFYGIIRLMPVLLFPLFINGQTFTPYNYWHFDGVNPTGAIDDSLNNYNLNWSSYNSSLAINSGGKVGKYATLNSSNGLLLGSPQPSAITDSFAFEFIMRTGQRWNTSEIIRSQDGAINIMFIWPEYNLTMPTINFRTVNRNGVQHELIINLDGIGRKNLGWFQDGNWHHFVFQYNPITGVKQIYIDGECPTGFSATVSTAPGMPLNSNRNIIINSLTPWRQMYADIDEIAVYKRTLTPQIVRQHYLDMLSGNHYSFITGITSVPAYGLVSGSVNYDEFPIGHPNYSSVNTLVNQLKSSPLPRYKRNHQLIPNFNWIDVTYSCGYLQPGITQSQYVQNTKDIQTQLCNNWNYHAYLPLGAPGTHDSSIALINRNPNWKIGYICLRAQIAGGTKLWNQSLPNDHYLQNASGQFINQNGVVSAQKAWRPTAPISSYNSDGTWQRGNIQNRLTNLNRSVDIINENGEVFFYYLNSAMSQDPVVTAAKNASGLDWQIWYADMCRKNDNEAYRDILMNQTKLANAKYTYYLLNGQRNYMLYWEKSREIMNQINGQYYSTGDLYVRWPNNWANWTGAWHGLDWVTGGRKYETRLGDHFFSPFIAAGWEANTENTVRPAQWLGFCKVLAVMGAEFFYSAYFNDASNYNPPNPPPNDPKGYAWQYMIPSYAQGTISREWLFYKNSKALPGDLLQNYENTIDSSYLFISGDLRVPVVVRKHNTQNKWMIGAALMNNTNQWDTLSLERTVYIDIPGQSGVKFKVRRQGSVYMFDATGANKVWYQLDAWHENKHPERWTKDIYLNSELFDTSNAVTIKTENFSGNDFTNANSYISFNSSGAYVSYDIKVPDNYTGNRYLWIRARSINGAQTGVNISYNSIGKTIDCITNISWNWYRTDKITSNPVIYSLQNNVLPLTLTAINNLIEIDSVVLIENSGNIFGETTVSCAPSLVATITPSNVSRCANDLPTLTANAATGYQWSTGATTQSIVAVGTGSYTVTITVAGQGTASATATVNINSVPNLATHPNVFNSCPDTSVLLSGIDPINSGASGTLTWHTTRAGAIANTGIANDTVFASGYRYYRTTTDSGCYDYDSVRIVINTCICSNPIELYAGADQNVCSGDSVYLSASAVNATAGYQWLPANGVFRNINSLNTAYLPGPADIANGYVNLVLRAFDPDGAGICTEDYDTVTIFIRQKPSRLITASGPISFCNGLSVTLKAVHTSGNNYSWFRNNVNLGINSDSLVVTQSGWYKATIVNFYGCSVTTDSVQVNVLNGNVGAGITANEGTNMCGSKEVNLVSNLATTYLWSNSATTRTIKVFLPGTYTVTVTNSNGCTGSSSITLVDTCAISACVPPYSLYTANVWRLQANLRWGGPNGTKGFVLYLQDMVTGEIVEANYNSSKRTVLVKSLKPNREYKWWMRSRCPDYNTLSLPSNTLTFKTKQ